LRRAQCYLLGQSWQVRHCRFAGGTPSALILCGGAGTSVGSLSPGFGQSAAMPNRVHGFWSDERGTAIMNDWIFVTSILVIALLPCMVAVRERIRQGPALNIPAIRADSVSVVR
jgi:hypothetical protein